MRNAFGALQERQGNHADNVNFKRKAIVALSSRSSAADAARWLSSFLSDEQFDYIDIENVDGPLLFSGQDLAQILGTNRPDILERVSEELSAISVARVKQRHSEDGAPEDGNLLARVKPEPEGGAAYDAHAADIAHPIVQPDIGAVAEAEGSTGSTSDDDVDDDGEESPDAGAEDGSDAPAHVKKETDAPRVTQYYVPAPSAIDEIEPVTLPRDPVLRQRYVKRVLCGVQIVLDQIGNDAVLVMATAVKAHHMGQGRRDAASLAKNLWNKLVQGIEAARDDVELLTKWVTDIKSALRQVLMKKKVQHGAGISRLLARMMPLDTKNVMEMKKASEEAPGEFVRNITVADIPSDALETLWGLWQRSPHLGTLTLPVFTHEKSRTLKGIEHLLHIMNTPSKALRPRASSDEDETTRVGRVLRSLHGLMRRNNATSGALWIVGAFTAEERAEDHPAHRLLTVDFFMDTGMVSSDRAVGLSACIRYAFAEEEGESGLELAVLLREMEHIKADASLSARLDRAIASYASLRRRFEALGMTADDKLQGTHFKKIMAMVSDTVQEWPADLEARLLPFMRIQLKNYQLASLRFVFQEEESHEGIQRHLWWKLPLADAERGVQAYFSPHMNTIWWATAPEHLHHWDDAGCKRLTATPVRNSRGLKLYGQQPRGGLLALDMGLGKTAVMIAAHALQQAQVPEPELLTAHTEARMAMSQPVLVGRSEETARERQLFTGFKQLGELGPIVPDGSIRYRGRGNLVVAPPTLVPQWEAEIHKLTLQAQKVIILHQMSDRRTFMTSRDGLRQLAEYDWVITTPTLIKKDIDMYRALEWRRVIADEAHQLQASMAGPGMNAAQRAALYMRLLASIPVTCGHWCLTGTPLRNLKQTDAMDRILSFLSTGVITGQHLTNVNFTAIISDIAIRFTKGGHIQGERVLELPPVTEVLREVILDPGDKLMADYVLQRLVHDSDIGLQKLLELQARESDDEGDDEDDGAGENGAAGGGPRGDATTFRMCSAVIDPMRKALSCAQRLFFVGAGPDMRTDRHSIIIGLPMDCRRPRKVRGQERVSAAEWRVIEAERLSAGYTETFIATKIEVMVNDIRDIISAGEANPGGPRVKIIVYSNFLEAFKQVRLRLDLGGYAYKGIEGSMSLKARAAALDDFRDNDDVQVFLLNKQCGAMGINLTVATHILILEPSWNPVWENQAISRANRLGQKWPITIKRYLIKESLERRLYDLMKEVNEQNNGAEDELTMAVESKGVFMTDEKALNETVARIFKAPQIARLLGHIGDDSDDDDEDGSDDSDDSMEVSDDE